MLIFAACWAVAAAGADEAPAEPLEGILIYQWGDTNPADPDPSIPGGYIQRILLDQGEGRITELSISPELLAGGVFRWNGRRVAVFPAAGAESIAPSEPAASPRVLKVAALRLLGDEKGADGRAASGRAAEKITGSQPWVSILCKFSDIADEPENLAFFQGMYANSPAGLDHYWREVSYDQIDIAGSTAVDWKVLPRAQTEYTPEPGSNSDADKNLLFDDCTAAADPFVDFSNGGQGGFAGINMMFNGLLDCCAWGGGRSATLDGVNKVWRVTWEPPWGYANEGVMAHEMGHGFGLPHANNGDGDGSPYDSPWDVMSSATGNSVFDATYGGLGKHINAYHKDRLEWYAAAERLEVPAGSQHTVTIDHTALATTSNYRMARIPIPGTSDYYTVEVRKRVGNYEANLPGDAVIIHEVVPGRSEPAWLVDEDAADYANTPGSRWTVGETFVDAANTISVEVLSATVDGFVVEITSGDPGLVFEDGFESGNVTAWSNTAPFVPSAPLVPAVP